MEITMIGRFEEACRHQGFCPAPYMTESMAARHCADGCCPDCGRFFQEEHPKAAEKMKDMLADMMAEKAYMEHFTRVKE